MPPHDTPHIAQLLGNVVRNMEAKLLRRLHATGYTDVRHALFVILRRLEPRGLRLTDLSALLQMTKQSAGELVSYLEARGC